ncbi:hypothetical protein M9Y10_009262 [Tritrichomonas musculus]|uniref:Vps16 C-terminal domain-containing protein n=1 Tax=Tritrichomonas musculus TaxID=1915356 RepID=A0ABR2IN32_9EUKA
MQFLDDTWPKAKRSYTIGNHQYQTINLGSYDSDEMDDLDNKYLPGPYGGYLLKFNTGSLNVFRIIRNDGKLHAHSAYTAAMSKIPQTGKYATSARNAFWCNNGYIGILDYKGGITIVTMNGEWVAYYPLDTEIERVACDYPFPDGIAFFTEGPSYSPNSYNFYVFTYASHTSERLCPSDKFKQSAAAVAYYDGKGFVAFSDNTLGFVNPQSENGEYVTFINKFDFLPHTLQISPHGSLIACYDDLNLFVRSAKSSDFLQPVTLKNKIGDVAFLDEFTVSFIAQTANNQTCVHTFQIDKKGIDIQVDLFTNCRISHLIQNYESVRFYKTYYSQDDKINYSDLNIITPLSEKIDTLSKPPYNEKVGHLIEAKQLFDKDDIGCYKIIEELRGKDQKKKKKKYNDDDHDELVDIITVIIDAAPHILEISNAQSLLSYGAFGKYFAQDFPHETFAECVRKMRILYNLRKCESFVTVESDFDNIEMTDFLSYIVQLEKYELAEQIARMFNLNRSIIAENWAINMFSRFGQSDPDKPLCFKVIVDDVLSRFDGIDFLRVARMAIYYNVDVNIIKKIIGLIGDPQIRMNFILNNNMIFQGTNDAQDDVISSKDGNAIISYLCIQRIINNTVVRSLLKSPILQELYSAFKSQEYPPDPKPPGYKKVMEIENYPSIKKFQLELIYGYRSYGSGFGLDVEHLNSARSLVGPGLWATHTNLQTKLIDQMTAIGWHPEPRPKNNIMWRPKPACSARKAMENAVFYRNEAAFKNIANMYEVSKTTQCWIKLYVLAREKRWDELAQWAKKSQALEWDTFAEVCAEHGNMELASAFIEKISNNERKIDTFIQFKMLDKALAVAKSTKNTQKISMIMQMMGK